MHALVLQCGGPTAVVNRCRVVRPDVLQRSSQAHVSLLDRTLAALAGRAAVEAALSMDGHAGAMVALRFVGDRWTTELVPLDQVLRRAGGSSWHVVGSSRAARLA